MQEFADTSSENHGNHLSLFKLSTLVYGVMTIVGASITHYGHDGLLFATSWPEGTKEISRHVGIGVVAAAFLLVLSYNFENWFASFRQLKVSITRLLGPCSVPMALYLALISSIGEEVLFRGAIQPLAGIFFTSVLFGLIHLGQDGKISSWSLWAVIAGFVLGMIYDWTGRLWPPIIAHFLVNAISILNLRRAYGRLMDETGDTGQATS